MNMWRIVTVDCISGKVNGPIRSNETGRMYSNVIGMDHDGSMKRTT